MCVDYTSSTLDLYKFNMCLFDHGKPEEFLLFLHNFIMTLVATEILGTDAKVQHICLLVPGKRSLILTFYL